MNVISARQVVNGMTVDVEDYYHVSNFADVIHPEEWPRFESRVERNTVRLLDIFATHDVTATFFILGWVAERNPRLVRAIQSAGHEVACHGYAHQLVYRSGPTEFRVDVRRAKKLLEDLTGAPVYGYRAPSFSIIKSSLWALDILAEEGFRYDSSIFPIRHSRYGIPDAERFPYRWRTGNSAGLAVFPISTLRIAGINVPVGGGGYLRLYPYGVTEWAIRRLNGREGKPAIVYIHPWEIDPEQPRIPGPMASRFRHYIGLHTTDAKLHRLLDGFNFKGLGSLLRLLQDEEQV